MRPQLDFRAQGPILDIKNLNFDPLEPDIHYFSSFLSYFPCVLWFCKLMYKNSISALKLNPSAWEPLHVIVCYVIIVQKLNKWMISHIFCRRPKTYGTPCNKNSQIDFSLSYYHSIDKRKKKKKENFL